MAIIRSFTFNPFQENTYVVYDDTSECIIIDAGCSTTEEEETLAGFIESQKLKVVRLIQTHCHIDHILGNHFVYRKWGLKPEMHRLEQAVLASGPTVSTMYGIPYTPSPEPGGFLQTDSDLTFGKTSLKMLFTPGHSPGSISFYNEEASWVIAGDVLFFESIGRTDLPGGDHRTLITSIRERLFTLPGNCTVYPGHGPVTTIAHEIDNNPFLR